MRKFHSTGPPGKMATSSCTVSSKQVEISVTDLYELINKKQESKTISLFDEDPEKIILMINLKIAPPGTNFGWKESRILLPYYPSGNIGNICLLVKDDKKGRQADDDAVVRKYKEKFAKENVNCVSEIIPLHVLRTQYATYNMKNNLSVSYDKFITDERIKMYLPKLLGKWFIEKQRMPIPVCLTRKNTKEQIEKAIRFVNILWMSRKSSYHVRVGDSSLKTSSTISNVLAILNQLPRKIPGGWTNVKSISISSPPTKISIPVFVSTTSANNVKFTEKDKFNIEPEELSTLPNAKVKVYPTGDIDVIKIN